MAECVTCAHAEREEIDRALVSGESQRSVAARFGLSKDTVRRHAAAHLSAALIELRAGRLEEDTRSALERAEGLFSRAERLLTAAEVDGKPSAALAAVRELRALVELLAKLRGELDERPVTVVNLAASEELRELQGVILAALGPHPEARQAVAGALLAVETVPGEVVP